MKILFFVGEFNGGGAERVISILANYMVKNGFDVEILKYHNTINSYETDSRVKINSVEENTNTRKNTLKNIAWIHKYFRSNCDVVVSFLAPFNILAIIANMFNKTPIIVADRNDPRFTPINSFVRLIRNILYIKANGIVLQTKNNKEYFSRFVQDKSIVIYNPVDLKDMVGEALKTKKEKLIVSVGRLEPQKNQMMLIDAFAKIHNRYPEYRMVIYGEGSYREELQKKINGLNLKESISMPGEVGDILNKLKIAELFVLPSNYEGMSNALIEAMCLGLPVISTDVSGSNDLIENGTNGILIDINDEKALVEKMRYLLDNEKICEVLGTEATKISKLLDFETICKQWLDYILTFMQ